MGYKKMTLEQGDEPQQVIQERIIIPVKERSVANDILMGFTYNFWSAIKTALILFFSFLIVFIIFVC